MRNDSEFHEESSEEDVSPGDRTVGSMRFVKRPIDTLQVPRTSQCEAGVQPFLATLNESSSFMRLSRTNDAPSEAEEAQLRAMLVVGRRHLSELGEDSVHAWTCQKKAENRLLLQQVLEKLVAILSPFRRLPCEIISQIVLHALGPDFISSPIRYRETKQSPWIYSMISHLWRAVVIFIPALWCIWDFRLTYVKSWAKFEALFHLLVERSQSAPLSIIIDMDIIRRSTMMTSFIEGCHRWKAVKFYCLILEDLSALEAVRGNLSQLESLELYFDITERQPNIPLKFDAFEVAPKLQELTLDIQDTYVDVVLPWAQLRQLDMSESSLTISDGLRIMRKFPSNLVSLSLPEIHRDEQSAPEPILQFNHLRSLRIQRDDHADSLLTPGILDFLTLPVLESVVADSISGPIPSLHHLLGRSGCSLTSLSIFWIYDYENLIDTLRLMPTLINLTLDQMKYDLNLIPSLIIKSSESSLLPRLTSFKIYMELEIPLDFEYMGRTLPHFDDAALAEMVESRNKVAGSALVAHLDTFHFEFFWMSHDGSNEPLTSYRLSPQVVERFKGLVAGGLADIYVRVGAESWSSNGSSRSPFNRSFSRSFS